MRYSASANIILWIDGELFTAGPSRFEKDIGIIMEYVLKEPELTGFHLPKLDIKSMDIDYQNGGYIAAPTHQVPADVSLENITALVDILKNQA